MERFTGLLGVALIFTIAFLFSNNRKAINYRLVISGVTLQVVIAILILKIPPVTQVHIPMDRGMKQPLHR